ncbi:MAG: hypothetical protein J7L89_08760, partial [Bacteroidales bacterium]|nr:hypothetical protein [Bacteroidales bacterium]
WLKLSGKEKQLTEEQIEKEYPDFASNLKWSLIKNLIIKEQELKADEEEIKKQAITSAYRQYQQYGIYQVEQEQLIQLAEAYLKDENEQRALVDMILEDKVIDYIRTLVKEDEKVLTLEEFKKLFD